MVETTMPETLDEIGAATVRWLKDEAGLEIEVTAIGPTAGNAGRGFSVRLAGVGAPTRIALRLAAAGLAEEGSNDVRRQERLLRALHISGVPVPAVHWATSDRAHFGVSAVAYEWVDALPLHFFDESLSVDAVPGDRPGMVLDAVDALALLHAVELPPWMVDPEATPVTEVDRWLGLVRRVARDESFETPLVERALAVGETIRDAAPDLSSGLMHGDFHTNNILFRDTRVAAIVDWEMAGPGPQLLDLAWLTMFCDPSCWSESHRGRMRVVIDPKDAIDRYAVRSSTSLDALAWCRALACFRFASMTLYNLRLHRTGRRPDATWEQLVESVPNLIESAYRFLEEADV